MPIDLNADVGEGAPYDDELLQIVSSANISCGAHAGDADTLADAIQMALTQGVRIGAHPSFPDREHWGRKQMQLSFSSLRHHLLYQLHALNGLVLSYGGSIQHVKPHGALYNQSARDPQLAQNIVRIVQEFNPDVSIMGLARGELVNAARAAGMQTEEEAFADRRYAEDGSLLPRTDPRAVISEVEEAIAQSLLIVQEARVRTANGRLIALQADTLCLHGDSPHALAFARQLRKAFSAQTIDISSPALHNGRNCQDSAPS